jgi:hypothetical protein
MNESLQLPEKKSYKISNYANVKKKLSAELLEMLW